MLLERITFRAKEEKIPLLFIETGREMQLTATARRTQSLCCSISQSISTALHLDQYKCSLTSYPSHKNFQQRHLLIYAHNWGNYLFNVLCLYHYPMFCTTTCSCCWKLKVAGKKSRLLLHLNICSIILYGVCLDKFTQVCFFPHTLIFMIQVIELWSNCKFKRYDKREKTNRKCLFTLFNEY